MTNRDNLIGATCTLDGKPATIIGRQNDFATVATTDGKMRFEWAWATVERIMSKGGRFTS